MIEVGAVIGGYRILEEVGTGGMGKVYRGLDTMLKREVAIKVLRPEMTQDPALVERFRNEAVVLARLSHPNIALLYNLLQYEPLLFMVMEFVRGETLDQHLREQGTPPYAETLKWFVRILDAIGYAHQHGVIHRDIKPSNIMITESGGVKVMDFGIARVLGTERMTREGLFVGTMEYMAPEQFRGQDSTERTDIYSLGLLLYEMLSGRPPFTNTNPYELMRAHIEMPPPRPCLFAPHISAPVEQAILCALSKLPGERFASTREFRVALLEGLRLVGFDSGALRTTAAEQHLLDEELARITAEIQQEAEAVAAETRHRLIEEARRKHAQEALRLAEVERHKRIEAARKQAEAEATQYAEAERQRLLETARLQAEQEAARQAETERQRLLEEARKHAEAEAEQRAAAERQRRVEAARKQAEAEAARLAVGERTRLLQEARRRAEQEASQRISEERQRLVEEALKQVEAEAARLGEAERQRLYEEARKRAEAEAARHASKERKRLIAEEKKRAKEEARQQSAKLKHDPYRTSLLQSGMPEWDTNISPPEQEESPARRWPLFAGVGLLLVALSAVFIYRAYRPLPLLSPPLPSPPSPLPSISPSPSASPTPAYKLDLVRIPGGDFLQGRDDKQGPKEDLEWYTLQIPAHTVKNVAPFDIDRTEVTNAEYALFVCDTGHDLPADWGDGAAPPAGREKWPVRNVSYKDAEAFAAWRSQRDHTTYRLPTETEWEFAAKGQKKYRYPWGNEWADDRANLGTGAPKPVGFYPKWTSPYGVLDMLGNVSEWTASPATIYPGNRRHTQAKVDQVYGGDYAVRGGNFDDPPNDPKNPPSVTARGFLAPTGKRHDLGFRLVRLVR